MRTFADADEVLAAKGQPLGHSQWRTITQEQVDQFAVVGIPARAIEPRQIARNRVG